MLSSHQTFNGTQSTEAKTVILLVKNASNFTSVDHHKWLLKRLFQPLSLEVDDNIQVLHVSNTPLASLIQSQNSEKKVAEIYTPQNLPGLQQTTDKAHRLMPHSRIITLNTKYRFVFLLDVTSSLTTIDCISTKDIVMSEVMQTTYRCLEGLVKPFIIQDLDKDRALQFEPEISITIIAECSNFASNANLIPKLAEFPTMRVLLQGVVVNKNNVSDIINNLHSELVRFQHEVVAFRQQLRRTTFPVTYVMEVEHESESSASYLDKKNLWRLGLSGSNLSYSLNAGLFAIKLLPDEGFPALMVITDGVVNSNLAQMSPDDDIIQQLCKENIKCNIIQVGPREGYNPGCNFGLLPDSEILQFVATATSGIFLYSADCPDVNVPVSHEDLSPLNFYHQKLLMKETYFTKRKSHAPAPHQMFDDNYNFPWDLRSLPPAVGAMPTRYREYSLSIDVMQLIFARMRNGFIIESIILVTGRNTSKAEKVHITMSRLWLPNITIQYKIKALWMGEVNGFSKLKSPRIEINVVADTILAIYLLNFQTARQNNDPSHPLFLKCIRLHKFMTMIYETDELLKKHVFFKVPKENNKLQSNRIASSNGTVSLLTRLELQKQLWDSLEQNPIRHNTNIWYDEAKFDILIPGDQPSVDKSSNNRQNKDAYSALKEWLKSVWSNLAFSDKVYIKILEGDKILPISFCELRINKESGSLVTGNLLFFNAEVVQRRRVLDDLINLINELNSSEMGEPLYHICKRPLSSFVRNLETTRCENEIWSDHRHVTGKSGIVKSYLSHWRWTWLSDIEHHVFLTDYRNMTIQDLAFQHLCKARLDEGCLLISESRNHKVFYQELELKEDLDRDPSANQKRLYGIQHYIYKDAGKIITELWMEPLQQPFLRDLYESVANRMYATDRQILSQIATFDQIHCIAKTHASHRRNSYGLALPKSSHFPTLFNLPILLKSSGLLIANYNIPSFKSSLSNVNQLHQYVHLQSIKSSPSSMGNEAISRSSFEDSRSPESSPYIRKGSISNRNSSHIEQRKLSLSLPKNPTIDVTYIIDRDSIALLSPLDRDFVLLHLFVEKTLANHADGEVNTNINCSKDSTLKEINNMLSKTAILQEASTTIAYIRNFRESRCFIKNVDFNSFLLIIIPSFKAVLDTLKQYHGFRVESKSCFMSIIIFLCKRLQPIRYHSIIKSLDFHQDQALSFEPISLFHETTNTVKNSLEPILLTGSFPENHTNFFKSGLSDQATRVTLNITKLYSHGFVKSVYASVLQKHRVTKADFLKAIDTCVETSVDIDITEYVNVHVKSSREGLDSDNINDIYQKFVAVLGHYFEPANFVRDELQNIYYYRPNFKKPNNLSIDTHENAADIAGSFLDVFNYAENPLFLRLECTFRKSASTHGLENIDRTHGDYGLEGSKESIFTPENIDRTHSDYGLKESKESSFVKFPVSSLPTSYSCTLDGKFYDFSPESIGTETSPVESSDGTTAILHLICLTLPRVDEVVEIAPGFIDLRTDDNVSSAFKNTKGGSLTTDKQEALKETRDRIDWLLKEEIMHGLLKSQPVEKLVLSFIQAQLKHKNPFVDFPTTFNVPLSFVRRKQGQERFLKEFSKADMSPYSLNQVEDCFYISEDEEKGESLNVTDSYTVFDHDSVVDGSSIEQNNIQEEKYDDYTDDGSDLCTGLGISVYSFGDDDPVPDHADQTVKSIKKHIVHKQLFWLLLIPQETCIQMYFYSKAVSAIERSNIIKHVRSCIIKISERVNRLILLDELSESRRCSKYLVPPDGSSDSDSSSEDELTSDLVDVLSMAPNDGNVPVSKKFKPGPGQFECPLVYRQSFPLHWRLRPNQALNGIASSILNSFAVQNRKYMFVISKGDYIVYLKLSEIEASTVYIDDENFDDLSRFANSELQLNTAISDESRKSPPNKNGGSPPKTASPNSRKLSTQVRADSRELVVEVFGLETPGKEITEKLMESLEKRLTSNITLTIMSTFIARNLKINPTPADVDFILPILKTPRRLSLKIPSYIMNVYAFLMYFKQNISLYLNTLQGPEVTNAIRRYYNSKYRSTEFPESIFESGRKTPTSHDIQLHEFVFFYNYINQGGAPSAVEASVGEGIAGLCFTLLNRQGRPIFELPVPDIVDSDHIDLKRILEYISNDEVFTVSDSNIGSNDDTIDVSYRLLIELWSHGALNYGILLDKITKSFRQSLCEYFIEVSITKGLGRVSLDNVENNIIQVTQNLGQDNQKSNEYVEPHVQHNFIEPVLALLKKAADLGNPALHALHTRLDMPSWMMDGFLSEVHELLVEVHDIFTPIILRTVLTESSPMYEIYRPKHTVSTTEESISVPHQYLLIAGLREMNTKYESCKPDDRRSSFGSNGPHSRRSSTEDISNEKSSMIHSRKSSWIPAQQRRLIEDIMMHTIANGDQANRISDLFRSCFLAMSINGFDLTIYIYNWEKNYADQVFTAMEKISDWHNKRIELLNNILHQKMGLFYHTSNKPIRIQPQTPLPVHSVPNTPRPMQSPMPGTILTSQRSQNDHPLHSQRSNFATDLMHVHSLIIERFPQRDIRSEEISPYSTELEENRFTLTSFDLNDILKDSCVEKVAACDISSVSWDALVRHGPPFMEACIRQAKIIQAHDNAEKVYEKWAKRYQEHKEDHPDTNEIIAKSDLSIIFRTSRLLHFCRTPLLFGGKVESSRSSGIHTVTAPDQQDKITISKWYKDMVETFLQEYSSYLERIGMQVVMGGKSGLNLVDDGDSVFSMYTASDNSILADYPAVFLLKALQGGSIMCEIRIQEDFVCVTLYTLNRRYGRRRMASPGSNAAEIDRHSLRVFTEECGRFKKIIHVNSFVYDFHLKYIKQGLETLENPPSFNVLEVLKAIIRRHSRPTYFSVHRIYHDTFSKELSSIPNDLFEYIIRNPLRYGFRSTNYDGKPIACFATLNEAKETIASTESDTKQQNKIVYDNEANQSTLIFTKENQCDESIVGKISLEYFVIVLHNDVGETSIEAETTVDSSEFHSHNRQSADLSHLDLSEIKNRSRKKLDSIISQAIQYYRRDSLWRILRNIKTNSGSNTIKIQDFLELTNQWYSRELITIYPDFREFLDMTLNWAELLDFLLLYHSERSRKLYEEDHHIHLVIFNSHIHDLLVHFILPNSKQDDEQRTNNNISTKPVVNVVCREMLVFKEFELQFAADIARTIGYWLWQKLI